jgi:hypothetical protein
MSKGRSVVSVLGMGIDLTILQVRWWVAEINGGAHGPAKNII